MSGPSILPQSTSSLFGEVFLTRAEKYTLANWVYKVECPGFMSAILNPFYEWIVKKVPKSVSPNVLSFCGLLFSIFAWQHSHVFLGSNATQFDLFVVGACIFMYMLLDDIDGVCFILFYFIL